MTTKKTTALRDSIRRALAEAHGALSGVGIRGRILAEHPDVDPATCYREAWALVLDGEATAITDGPEAREGGGLTLFRRRGR